MPADLTGLQAALDALTTQVAATETVEGSAVTLINGFAAAVTKAVSDAIAADNSIDNSAISTVSSAIEAVRARFAASGAALGSAVTANTPSA